MISPPHGAKVVQLVEYDLAKVEIVGSSPILRSSLNLFRAVLAVVQKFDWEIPLRSPEHRRNTGLRGNRTKNRCKSVR